MIALTVDAWGKVLDAIQVPRAYSTGRQHRMIPGIALVIEQEVGGEPDEVVEVDFDQYGADEWDVSLTIAQAAGIVVYPS
jgi:hypothetical protein